jgi:hypothetical protein
VLAGGVAVVAYLFPRGTTAKAPPASSPSAPPVAAAPASTAPGSTPAGSTGAGPATGAASLALTTLRPSAGAAFLGRGSRADRLVLPCPTDASRNQSRQVVYELRGGYSQLIASVRVTGSSQPPGRSFVEVFADDQRTATATAVVAGDGDEPLSATLLVPDPILPDPQPAHRLTLRLTCQRVGPTVTLLNPLLVP